MNRLKQYLKLKWTSLLLYITPIVLTMIVMIVYQLDGQMIQYILWLSLFVGVILFVISLIRFEHDQLQQEELQVLQDENHHLKQELHHIRLETETYFLTWLHQMKTPIAGAQLLLREECGDNANELRLLMTEIDKYTSMALSYIKLMNPGTDLEFTKLTLDELLSPLIKKYRYQFFYYNVSLEYERLIQVVITDGHWSSLMIEQILSNALKYCQNENDAKISIYFNEATQELAIQDNGIGIQASDLTKIFDKGYVGFNGRLHEKASGLGLYLVDLISERLTQPVRVESELDQGSIFYIKFNLAKM
ncbi:sensor histidine kinase [Globicatella sp. PHS-GS-PNBC-21-1553]|uniref:sensor histidine kinase n=1 Tax=Globicatella sp. PHS-GS-PNBC-21-1553 TaxID=2885764 RepID=UPI00298EFC76|nr:sensor histidine kinase [Globicatella sp. PHS-GS-PNBC-21-1553]WPC09275.1 sensor histidine kinase [Globicatella sp. PHS-GS-PNBC-21-1553]